MDLIDGDDIGEWEAIELYILVKNVKGVRVRDIKLPCDDGGRSGQVSERIDDHQFCRVRITLVLVQEVKRFVDLIHAGRICAAPTALLELKDALIVVLEHRMVNGPDLDPPGVHPEATQGTKTYHWRRFQGEDLFVADNLDIRDREEQKP